MPGQAFGRATVKLDGKALRSKPGASIQLGGYRREYALTDQREGYYTETEVPAEVKCTMPHMSDTDLVALRNFKNGTVQFITDHKRVYTVPNACFGEMGEVTNGEVEVTFRGEPAK